MTVPAHAEPPDSIPLEAPTAPTAEEWERMTPRQREQAVHALLSSESVEENEEREAMAEGDPHLDAKMGIRTTLRAHFGRLGRRIYVGADIKVYYPGHKGFTPDVIALADVDPRPRDCWMVSLEGKGVDLALEVHYLGDWDKDFVKNVKKYAALGVREYFVYDIRRETLKGYSLPHESAKHYQPIQPRVGRLRSSVLDLDLTVEAGRLRFYLGAAQLVTETELIGKLEQMVDAAVTRAEQQEALAGQATSHLSSAILTILTVRNLPVTPELRARILACNDLPMLERWLQQVATVTAAEQLLVEP